MKLGEVIDRIIEPFDPGRVRRRMAERAAVEAMRDYDVARRGRRTQGWRRVNSSADREGEKGRERASAAGYDLVRNNIYAAAIEAQLKAHLVGDGIAIKATHRLKTVAKRAQDDWDAFAASRVDGRHDVYGIQRMACSGMIVGGETLVVWQPDDHGPNGRCRVLEGAYLDATKNRDVEGENLIVQGVEFNENGDRVAYWLFDRHPDDHGFRSRDSRRFAAEHVDHVFDQVRPGQTRGVSWLAPHALPLRDISELQDAGLMREKIAACVALILTPGENGGPTSPFDGASTEPAVSREVDTLRPGLIFRARPGETATTLTPTPTNGARDLVKQQLMGVAASTVPYHILSGDPSEANYSSLRAITNPFHTRLDDVQQNILVPFLAVPAFERRMKRLALMTGDKRFLEVVPECAFPPRRYNDPIKDLTGELLEIRAGLKSFDKALSERGLSVEDQLALIKAVNDLIDQYDLALEIDPRRLTTSGVLQAATGYLAGKQ